MKKGLPFPGTNGGLHRHQPPGGGRTLVTRSEMVTLGLELGVFLCALALFLLHNRPGWQPLVGDLSINFVALIVEAMPFMVIGSMAGGILEVFVPQERFGRFLSGRSATTVFLAGGLGLLAPVCECAIVPVVRRLLRKGVPLGGAIAFLLAGPIVNVIVAWSTAVAYRLDWTIVLTRLACGYGIAILVALTMDRLFTVTQATRDSLWTIHHQACACCGHDHQQTQRPLRMRMGEAVSHACEDFFEVGRYLVIGAFIAALTRSTVSMETFGILMTSPGLAILLMMALAILLNLCSEADAFIAASFRTVLPLSSQMAFMVLGPMLDIKLVLMYLSFLRKRAIITLSLLTFTSVLLAMLALEYLAGGR
ncbi:MAG: permease [Thermodesulfobacteriota bacterium]